jgi:hypothetical protein
MIKNISTTKFWLITGLILAAIIFRIIPHPFNLTPVTAIALFAGAKFRDKKWSVIIPVAAMFLSDMLLSVMNHYDFFHNTIFFVYGAFLLIIVLGWNLQSNKLQTGKTALFAVLSSVLFFIITNFAVWVFGGLYTLDADGFVKCFILAIPFFKSTLLGDLFFSALLFGAYEFVVSRYPGVSNDLSLEKANTVE